MKIEDLNKFLKSNTTVLYIQINIEDDTVISVFTDKDLFLNSRYSYCNNCFTVKESNVRGNMLVFTAMENDNEYYYNLKNKDDN